MKSKYYQLNFHTVEAKLEAKARAARHGFSSMNEYLLACEGAAGGLADMGKEMKEKKTNKKAVEKGFFHPTHASLLKDLPEGCLTTTDDNPKNKKEIKKEYGYPKSKSLK